MTSKRALVLIAKGSEELEAVSVINILRRASVEVTIAGVEVDVSNPVLCANKTPIQASVSLESLQDREAYDLLVLPGGSEGSKTFCCNSIVQGLLKTYFSKQKFIGAICAAPTAIQAAGIAHGYNVTSYPGLQSTFAANYNYKNERVVKDRNLITSRGPATAIDFGLALAEVLVGTATKDRVAKEILATDPLRD